MASQNTDLKPRKGAATVELAFVLPVFVALIFGSIEVNQRLHTKQSALISAYESCRVATRPISDTDDVVTHCQTLLTQQNVQGATIQVRNMTQSRNDLVDVATGDEIRVRITVSWAANTVSNYVVGNQGNFVVQAFMLRE